MNTTRSSTSTWLFGGLFLAFGLFIIISLWNIASTTDFGESDFMIYWAATYLLRTGQNPYNVDLIRLVQQTVIHVAPDINIMAWNPPFLFIFLMPLTWLSFIPAKFAWLILSILIVLTAAIMLTGIYMKAVSPRVKLAFVIFAISFPAVLTGLYMGQVTFFVFWGLVASIALIKKEQWFWAGAVLILTTIKPHMVVLPVLYLLIYMAQRRKYQGWAGLAITGVVLFAILLLFRSDLIYHIIGETSVGTGRWATATLGGLLSYLGITEAARYLILLLLPLPFLLAKYPEKFNLELSVALLALITIPTTIFGWSYDQTMLLIPIAQIFSWISRSKYKLAIIACMVVGMAFNYYQRVLPINEVFYVWIPFFWWFIFGITWYSLSPMENRHVANPL